MIRTKGPKCKCGCGKRVTKSVIHPSGWNKFLPGHNLKVKLPKEKELERRRKISETMTAFLNGNEEARQARRSFTGKTHSKQARKIMSEKAKERERNKKKNGWTHSQETRKKISEAMKAREITWGDKISASSIGKIIPQDQRDRTAKTLRKYYETHDNPFKGKTHSEETRKILSEKITGMFRGENGPNWRDGISSLPYGPEWTPWLKEEIRQRDGNRCSICGKPREEVTLDVHHIDFDKNNNDPSNLITLCKKHHGRANFKIYKTHKLHGLIKRNMERYGKTNARSEIAGHNQNEEI